MHYKLVAFPVAGKYQGRLCREVERPSQLNRFSNHKPELITIATTGKVLFDTAEEAEAALLPQSMTYVKTQVLQ